MRVLICGVLLCFPLLARAAPNEIKVFSDELADYGEQSLETHVNKVSRAGRNAENHATPFQVMPEYSYGIWRNWELSFQLPIAAEQGRIRTNGYRGELQYVAPHDGDEGFYWGFNVEVANLARNGEERIWNLEFVPIVGLRIDRWHLIGNPGINRALSGSSRKINFEPAGKVAYRVTEKNYFGVEYYVDAGALQHLLPKNQQSHVLFLAWDGKIGKSDINVGIGRGFTDASDRWVLKTVFEFSF